MEPVSAPAGGPVDPSERRHVRKRVFVPLMVLGLFLVLIAVAVVRGTWADTQEKNPASPRDGVITQLYKTAEGRKVVRCAVLIDQPMKEVWAAVTDYDRYLEIFPTLASAHARSEPGGKHRLQGEARWSWGTWDYDILISHQESPERCVTSWDSPGGDATVDRGSWTLTPVSEHHTLVVYQLEAEIGRYPNFLVRNVLLGRQRHAVAALADWSNKKTAP